MYNKYLETIKSFVIEVDKELAEKLIEEGKAIEYDEDYEEFKEEFMYELKDMRLSDEEKIDFLESVNLEELSDEANRDEYDENVRDIIYRCLEEYIEDYIGDDNNE